MRRMIHSICALFILFAFSQSYAEDPPVVVYKRTCKEVIDLVLETDKKIDQNLIIQKKPKK